MGLGQLVIWIGALVILAGVPHPDCFVVEDWECFVYLLVYDRQIQRHMQNQPDATSVSAKNASPITLMPTKYVENEPSLNPASPFP